MTKVIGFIGNEMSPLQLMIKLKQDRQLTDEEIDRLGIRLVPSIETKSELGWPETSPLIKIPYFGITGEKLADNRGNQLCRYRRSVVNDKGERYTQRAGTGARHYLAPGQDWINIAKDTGVELFYTEGEFKAITSCKFLGPTVANAGVSSWRGLGSTLAAPLNEFEWRDRRVYIVYDAEATSTAAVPLKQNVARELGALAFELQISGAVVKSLLIAKTKVFVEGQKMGVDDYFHAGGTKEELLSTAEDPEVDKDWLYMSNTYAIYRGSPPSVMNILTGISYTAKQFADLVEPHRKCQVGKKIEKIANLYREHPGRNEIDEIVFDPSFPFGYLRDERKFNTWRGFAIKPVRSENYDSHIRTYLDFQSGVWGPAYVDFFLNWAAHLFQRPWELTTISPILVSRSKGVGKSITGQFIRHLIGDAGSLLGDVTHLTEHFTGKLEGKILVQVDEADALFEGKEERLKILDSDKLFIRKMYTDGYTVPNILRKFYTTNKNAPWRIDSNERRYYVVRVNKLEDDGKEDSEWSRSIRQKVGPLLENKEALSNIMWFFMNRDITDWDPKAPVPITEAMLDMCEAGESKKDTVAHELFTRLEELGVWVTDSTLSAVDRKMWGEVRAMLKEKGGRSVQGQFKDGRINKPLTICMTKDHLLEIKEDSKKGAKLAAGQLSGDQIKILLAKTRAETAAVIQLVNSEKY